MRQSEDGLDTYYSLKERLIFLLIAAALIGVIWAVTVFLDAVGVPRDNWIRSVVGLPLGGALIMCLWCGVIGMCSSD